MIFRDIPYVVILTAVVSGLACAFYLPYMRNRSRMTMLWLVAWLIVIVRSMLPHLHVFGYRLPYTVYHTISDAFLALQAIIFLWSFAAYPTDFKRLHVPWAEVLMAEVTGYCIIANVWNHPSHIHSAVLLISHIIITGTLVRWLQTSAAIPVPVYALVVLGTAGVGMGFILRGMYFPPIYMMQSTCNLFAAIYLLRRFRVMPGASFITGTCFLLWAGMPYAYVLQSIGPAYLQPFMRGYLNSISLVALMAGLGMLVLLLEEEILINVRAREREHRVRQELESYAQLDLHMMPGSDPRQAAERVCRLAVEHSIFHQAMIYLRDVKQSFFVAASENMDEDLIRALDALGRRMTDSHLQDFHRDLSRQRISPHSARVNLRALFLPGDPLQRLNFVSAISINLRSQNGVIMGSMLLGSLKAQANADDLRADDLLPLETLVAKLAIAIENAMLTQRLLRSEKLAGLGQLAGGVAHELNNPLTVVMGYSELMSDAEDIAEIRAQSSIIHRESLRMKEIVESLVRFWKPAPSNSGQISLSQTLHDIHRLRAPEIERRGIELEINVPDDLPSITGNPDQLKQVFMQLLNNAVEAIASIEIVDSAPPPLRRIRIDGSFDDSRIHILF